MLRNFGILTEDPTPSVEQYFQQCSISVTCRDLGIMAATLANRGVNPVTGKQAIRGEYVESVLSVMGSCGMYDYAGEWIYRIGMPAKSGVSGGVIAVLPGHLGIGVFSPRLDSRGNSVRGIAVCDEFSRRLDLHMFNRPSVGRSCLRLKTTAAEFNSNRIRTSKEAEALRSFGDRVHLYKLQGNLVFATAEHIVGDVMQNHQNLDYLLLDFKQVMTVNESACRLFYQLHQTLRARGKAMLFVRIDGHPLLRRYMKAKLGDDFETEFLAFDESDLALEWCENRLLEFQMPRTRPEAGIAPEDYELFRGFSASELAQVVPLLERCRCQAGEVLIRNGDQAEHLYLLARGQVSVWLPLESGNRRRLATVSVGMSFGEMAIIDRAPRSALVIADTEVECDRLSLDAIQSLEAKDPRIKIRLLENLAQTLSGKLRKANRELAVLD
jgi:glutaminase